MTSVINQVTIIHADNKSMTSEYIQNELGSDEKLIWSGKPKQGVVLQDLDYVYLTIGVFMLVTQTFAMASLINSVFERPNVSFFPGIVVLVFLC